MHILSPSNLVLFCKSRVSVIKFTKYSTLFFCFIFTFNLSAVAQNQVIDSLKYTILSLETDSNILIPDVLGNVNVSNNPDSAIYYGRRLIAYGKQRQNQRIISEGYNIIAFCLYNKGNYPGALIMAFQSLRDRENSSDKLFVASTYNIIGNIYKGEQNYPKALFYYRRSKQTAIAANIRRSLNTAYLNLAFVFAETGVLDSGLYYADKAAYGSQHFFHGRYMSYILGTMADIYYKQNHRKLALQFYQRACAIDTKNADFRSGSISFLRFARFYKQTNKPDSAIYYAKQSYNAAKKASFNKSVFESTDLLAQLYEAKNATDSSFKYLKISGITKDSLYNSSKSQEVENLTTDEFLRQSEIQAAQAAYHNKLRLTILLFSLVIFIIVAFLQRRNSLQRKKAYNQLQQQHNQIEAQKVQAQIEVALERVRSRTMAMQRSNELAETVSLLFKQLLALGIGTEQILTCGIVTFKSDEPIGEQWITETNGEIIPKSFIVRYDETPAYKTIYECFKNGEKFMVIHLEGATLNEHFNYLESGNVTPLGNVETTQQASEIYNHVLYFSQGCLFIITKEALQGYHDTFKRFGAVFQQSYTRFLDLQKAEEQAREAVKQASLDRVRGEIASMRKKDDLEQITPLIWNELTTLGIPFIRCGVFIIDEQQQVIHSYLSTPAGKALAVFDLRFDAEGIGREVLAAWRSKQIATVHWTQEEFATYARNLIRQDSATLDERYAAELPKTSLDLHFFPFSQGMLYAGNTQPLTGENIALAQSLADAFSTAYSRYEDFSKLDLAKQEVEKALIDLKSAQNQLVQSEKMASLGELTAGIAHEIQNPLNFVNNFSEVNREIIDELEEELKAGNIDEALAIAADIKQNEEKINHHGKRADGIVKGMLQHSRTSGGDKQLTNINAIADEFMRLAYHGLRAKDKTFNAEMVTHFDAELPKIEVVAQEIGRVMLNLFNNAFYAVNQKQKLAVGGAGYKPEISVTTSTEKGHVVIRVKDNGIGMQNHVKDKIMQPFFTTKPTGEGTGLGLSLTYDMVVKGHGGSIQVNSTEGEGSEFIITLPVK